MLHYFIFKNILILNIDKILNRSYTLTHIKINKYKHICLLGNENNVRKGREDGF